MDSLNTLFFFMIHFLCSEFTQKERKQTKRNHSTIQILLLTNVQFIMYKLQSLFTEFNFLRIKRDNLSYT